MGEVPSAVIAVLMTSHNRRTQTVSCLESLLDRQQGPTPYEIGVVLVDAGSTDGTCDAVSQRWSQVCLVEADMDTYWGGGMRRAGFEAGIEGLDFHLWLNDDVLLDEDALDQLLRVAADHEGSIVVGQLRDSLGKASYGGFRRGTQPLNFRPNGIQNAVAECDTFNGNVVLVPNQALKSLGHIDPAFPHAMGDIDYGLRALEQGIVSVQCPGSLGICDRNDPDIPPPGASPWTRLKRVSSVKRLPPKAWFTLCRRHGGALAAAYFLKPYLAAIGGQRVARVATRTPECHID